MSDTITVKSKKELAELLMSGGEWEDIEYGSHCYYIESSINPFMAKRRDGDIMPMGVEWTTPQWRKVKYQPKHNEVVLAWSGDMGFAILGVYRTEIGFIIDGRCNGTDYASMLNKFLDVNYAPYTGTVPPHIQKFLDGLDTK